MAAATGASRRESKERMGDSSPRAALIYQHATRERDEAIAAAMGEVFASSRRKITSKGRSDATGTKEGRGVVIALAADWQERPLTWGSGWSGRRESNPHDQLGRLLPATA